MFLCTAVHQQNGLRHDKCVVTWPRVCLGCLCLQILHAFFAQSEISMPAPTASQHQDQRGIACADAVVAAHCMRQGIEWWLGATYVRGLFYPAPWCILRVFHVVCLVDHSYSVYKTLMCWCKERMRQICYIHQQLNNVHIHTHRRPVAQPTAHTPHTHSVRFRPHQE